MYAAAVATTPKTAFASTADTEKLHPPSLAVASTRCKVAFTPKARAPPVRDSDESPFTMPIRFSITRKLKEITNPQMNATVRKRLEYLAKRLEQADASCKLRDDSRMAWLWATRGAHARAIQSRPSFDHDDKDNSISIDAAAKRILVAHWLHTRTDYRYVAEHVIDSIVADLVRSGITRGRAHNIALKHALPGVKNYYAQTHGVIDALCAEAGFVSDGRTAAAVPLLDAVAPADICG